MVGGSSIPTRPHPRTELQAKFSVQYVVARALLDGAVKLEHFEEAAISEAAVTDLLARMQAKAHPDMPDDADSQWAAEVVVHTTDGRRLAHRIDNLMADGRRPSRTASPACGRNSWIAPRRRILPGDMGGAVFERLDNAGKRQRHEPGAAPHEGRPRSGVKKTRPAREPMWRVTLPRKPSGCPRPCLHSGDSQVR